MSSAELTILVIDDSADQLRLFSVLLRSAGYRVLTADSGSAGLEVLERETVNLVVCDMMMPEMDGQAFIANMRMREGGRSIPVVLLSAMGSDLSQDAERFGADALLSKGSFETSVLPQIEELLRS